MTIALAMMLRKFRFELVPGYKWTYRTFSLTLKPVVRFYSPLSKEVLTVFLYFFFIVGWSASHIEASLTITHSEVE